MVRRIPLALLLFVLLASIPLECFAWSKNVKNDGSYSTWSSLTDGEKLAYISGIKISLVPICGFIASESSKDKGDAWAQKKYEECFDRNIDVDYRTIAVEIALIYNTMKESRRLSIFQMYSIAIAKINGEDYRKIIEKEVGKK